MNMKIKCDECSGVDFVWMEDRVEIITENSGRRGTMVFSCAHCGWSMEVCYGNYRIKM